MFYSAKVREGEQLEQKAPQGYKPPRVFNTIKHKFDGEGYFDDRRRHLFVIPAEGARRGN